MPRRDRLRRADPRIRQPFLEAVAHSVGFREREGSLLDLAVETDEMDDVDEILWAARSQLETNERVEVHDAQPRSLRKRQNHGPTPVDRHRREQNVEAESVCPSVDDRGNVALEHISSPNRTRAG